VIYTTSATWAILWIFSQYCTSDNNIYD
jgi:hypothetical protein